MDRGIIVSGLNMLIRAEYDGAYCGLQPNEKYIKCVEALITRIQGDDNATADEYV
jgi:hypothetical protein